MTFSPLSFSRVLSNNRRWFLMQRLMVGLVSFPDPVVGSLPAFGLFPVVVFLCSWSRGFLQYIKINFLFTPKNFLCMINHRIYSVCLFFGLNAVFYDLNSHQKSHRRCGFELHPHPDLFGSGHNFSFVRMCQM